MRKRHPHISPTLDLIAKKIFSIPDVTAKFFQEVLDLPIQSVEILEGNQIHEQGFLGDYPFETSVDVRAKLDSGLEVIIEIQVMKQEYFVNRFYYYLANQLIENVRKKRKKGKTHQMYEDRSMGLRFWRRVFSLMNPLLSMCMKCVIPFMVVRYWPIARGVSATIYCDLPF